MAGMTVAEARATFRQLHRPGDPLVMPNAWDAGSARLLASLGAAAIATTSSGFAATLGRRDGAVTADEAITHVEALVAASPVPVSADLEDCLPRRAGGRRRHDPAGGRRRSGRRVGRGLHPRRWRIDPRRGAGDRARGGGRRGRRGQRASC